MHIGIMNMAAQPVMSSTSPSLQTRLPFASTIQRAGSIKDDTQKVLTEQAHKLVKQADKHEQFLSKVTYCIGVLMFGLFCYLLGSSPQDIPRLYCLFFIFAVPLRWIYYRFKKWHYYLLDFCYYANVIFVTMLLFFPKSDKLFMLCFSLSEGPLAWALIVWRCSLVFSSIDKIISVLIHLLPGTVFFILRWWDTYTWSTSDAVEESGPFLTWPVVNSIPTLWMWLFFVPLMVYCIWQGLYFLVVEGLRRQRILKDPELMTSYRELKRKAERANNIWWRLSGLLGAENRVYMYAILQAAFTVTTLALTVPIFKDYRLHIGFEVFKLAATVWNGGNFLFEVMPRQAAKKKLRTERNVITIGAGPSARVTAPQMHPSSITDENVLGVASSTKMIENERTGSVAQEVICALCRRPSQENLTKSSVLCGPNADEDAVQASRLLKWVLDQQKKLPGRRAGHETTASRNGVEWRRQVSCAG